MENNKNFILIPLYKINNISTSDYNKYEKLVNINLKIPFKY